MFLTAPMTTDFTKRWLVGFLTDNLDNVSDVPEKCAEIILRSIL